MSFTFSRSGGFAGAATSVRGSVVLKADGGSVTGPANSGYERTLSAQESRRLAGWLQDANRTGTGNPSNRPMPDAFQYSLTLLHDPQGQGADPQGQGIDLTSPGNAQLASWVEQECGRIWEHLIHKKKAGA